MSKTRHEFSEGEFIRRTVKRIGCSEEEAELFLLREHEYFRARGLEEYEGIGAIKEPIGMGIEEQFRFVTKTTDLPADLVNALMRLEMMMQIEAGILCLTRGEAKDICQFTEEDNEMCDRWYDFSEVMYKLGYMYENGIGFEKNEQTADFWYDFAYREGRDRNKPFLFTAYLPEPLRKE